ncbi:MAG TPA: hypothetical protein VJ225_06730, partial [Nitrososphaeraceae archaeon]|nr:hypothetical protein [Nitrososphaeraceae archaeon]
INDKRFCACCGMQLRTTPVETQYKVKMRQIEKSRCRQMSLFLESPSEDSFFPILRKYILSGIIDFNGV